MNENVFRQLLGEMIESEFAEYDNSPEWKFSLKHRLAMKRIFARYKRNEQKLKEKSIEQTAQHHTYHNIKQRLIIALCVVFLLTFLVGWVVAFVSKDFHGTVYEDNTRLSPVNLENAPLTIEYTYTLSSVPDGFELIETFSSLTNVYTLYENNLTNQTIDLSQWVKSNYTPHINTEHQVLEEIDINGSTGLFVDFSSDTYNHSLIIWDNGDYIIEISANLNKEDTLKLLRINKP